MRDPLDQSTAVIRLEWGPVGAGVLRADIAVVVDVLSFSTAVSVAVERGMQVVPSPWRDDRAREIAHQRDAVLAVGRSVLRRSSNVAPSLSPASLMTCRFEPRIVLPSPNGSTIAERLAGSGAVVVAGCLRNARAVGMWITARVEEGTTVAVVPAGERWVADGSLRPALEDHLGAGAILAVLLERGLADRMSPEASAAAELFRACADTVPDLLRRCSSGRELSERGFDDDVDIAADVDASTTVPVLVNGAFSVARS